MPSSATIISQQLISDTSISCSNNQGQTFTSLLTGNIDQVALQLSINVGAKSVDLYIYNNVAKSVLLGNASGTLVPGTMTKITFSPSVPVTFGTTYYLFMGTGYTLMSFQSTDVYTNGTRYCNDEAVYGDLRFAIYNNSAPTIPQISSPSNNSRQYNNSINFTWNQSTDTDSDTVTYDFFLSSQSDFSNTVNRTNFTNNWTGNIATTDGVTYYGKVRSYDGYEYSAWSTIVQFTENTAPTTPSLIQHNNFHVTNQTTVNFTISTDNESDSLTYDIKVWNASNGTLIINQSETSNNYSNSFLTVNWSTYNYAARSYDGYEYSNWSTNKTFQFTNSLPSISDTNFLRPPSPSTTTNLTLSLNITTDPDGDGIVNHTLWYKNGILNTSWNDTIILNYTGNFTLGDSIYVKAYLRDGYENTSLTTSNTVIIGSGNSAPSISSITLNPTIRKYNKQVWINSSNIADAESSYIRLLTYYKLANESKIYLNNSTWYAPPSMINVTFNNPWNDSNSHYIYAQVEDSGNLTGLYNLTSGEVQSILTGDTTPPSVSSSSLSATSIYTGVHVIINLITSLSNGTVSNASVHVSRPDATESDYVMTTTNNTLWTYEYTTTSDVGSYYIEYFSMQDDSSNRGTETSVLTFTASVSPTGSTGGGGGGGGSTIVVVKSDNGTLTLVNITSAESLKDLLKLGECFSNNLLLSNDCARNSISIVDQPLNWWVLSASYLGSLFVLFITALMYDEKKKFAENTLFYGTISWVTIILLNFSGLNPYILNYIFNSPLPGWMFLSFFLYGSIVTIVGDSYQKKKQS